MSKRRRLRQGQDAAATALLGKGLVLLLPVVGDGSGRGRRRQRSEKNAAFQFHCSPPLASEVMSVVAKHVHLDCGDLDGCCVMVRVVPGEWR